MSEDLSYLTRQIDEADRTPGQHGLRWEHYDMLAKEAGNEAIKALREHHFQRRAWHQYRERLFGELAGIVASFLPNPRTTPASPTPEGTP
jgi:hypothetical protein